MTLAGLRPLAGVFVELRPVVVEAGLRRLLRVVVVDTASVAGLRRAFRSVERGKIDWQLAGFEQLSEQPHADATFFLAGPDSDYDYLRLIADEVVARVVGVGASDARCDICIAAPAAGLLRRRCGAQPFVRELAAAATALRPA